MNVEELKEMGKYWLIGAVIILLFLYVNVVVSIEAIAKYLFAVMIYIIGFVFLPMMAGWVAVQFYKDFIEGWVKKLVRKGKEGGEKDG